jgi:hypothetical protein
MKARLLITFVALVSALTLLTVVQVGTGSAAVWNHTYRGQVMSYDRNNHMVAVSGKDGERTFDLSRATINGPIRRDETIVVKYGKRDGRMVASSVDVVGRRMERHEGYGIEHEHGYDMDREHERDRTGY